MLVYNVSEKENGNGSEAKSQEIHHNVHSHPRALRAGLGYRLWREELARDAVSTGFRAAAHPMQSIPQGRLQAVLWIWEQGAVRPFPRGRTCYKKIL